MNALKMWGWVYHDVPVDQTVTCQFRMRLFERLKMTSFPNSHLTARARSSQNDLHQPNCIQTLDILICSFILSPSYRLHCLSNHLDCLPFTGLQSEPPRWLSCVTETQSSFSSVVSRVYIKEKFNQKKKDAVIGMISEIRQAFKDNFATVDWMLEEDKVKAIEKVDLMKASVAFPEDINDLSEERRIYGAIIQLDPETYLENFLRLTEVVLIDQLYVLITKNKDR
ncbi:hypothetical protein AHF37_08808 [Paragonimus kellicotti]|nr:hypothetical protein AHF37_08808 [Paragonimus kellicotti]